MTHMTKGVKVGYTLRWKKLDTKHISAAIIYAICLHETFIAFLGNLLHEDKPSVVTW